MRVALTFPGCHRRGGIERVMLECANFLAARGHETHVFANEFDDAHLARDVVRRRLKPTFEKGTLGMLDFSARSRRAIRQGEAFNVRATFGVQSPPDGVLWMQSVHAAWIDICRSMRSGWPLLRQRFNPFHAVALRYERHIVGGRRYRKLIALTEQVKQDLIRFYDVPGADVVVVPNGFNPEEFHPRDGERSREDVRKAIGIRDRETAVVLFVANELERKGFRQLLQAVARSRDANTHVVAVGRFDPADGAAEAAAQRMSARVTFLPSSANLKPLYMAADLFALPTQYEAWGLVLVEALACGLPVLTSRLAGAAVAVREGVTGELLDDPFDVDEITMKLGRALALRGSDRANVAETVADYRWDRVLPAYERVLVECSR